MENVVLDRYVIFAVLAAFIIAMIIASNVLKNTPETKEFETLKIPFAAVTFTGIMLLVLLIGILAISINTEASTEIFKTIMTAMSPIAGGIIGYLFSFKENKSMYDRKLYRDKFSRAQLTRCVGRYERNEVVFLINTRL